MAFIERGSCYRVATVHCEVFIIEGSGFTVECLVSVIFSDDSRSGYFVTRRSSCTAGT